MEPTKVTLLDGFKVGEQVFTDAVLRLPTAGDIIDAGVDSERLVPTPNGFQLLMSDTLIAQHTLRRQIVRIGEHKGPLTLAELRLLSAADLQLLQQAAQALDGVVNTAMEELAKRGRAAAPGGRTG